MNGASNAFIDLTGRKIAHLQVLARAPNRDGSTHAYWRCRCDCGVETTINGKLLRNGGAKSCGCQRGARLGDMRRTHGKSRTRAFQTWANMLQRCENQKRDDFVHYGGRDIKVCERWHTFENFHADMGDPPAGAQLDRIDNDNGYEPGNCRWASVAVQRNNTRHNRLLVIGGERMTLAEAAHRFAVNASAVTWRLDHGWPDELAIFGPSKRRPSARRDAR